MRLSGKEQKRYNAGIKILKIMENETSIISKPLFEVNIKNIPDSVEPLIRNHIRTLRNHEIYGSAALKTRSIIARSPADLDIVTQNPKQVAIAMARIIRSKGIKVKVVSNPQWDSHVVHIFQRGEWRDAIDIHPIKDHTGKFDVYGSSKPPTTKKGIQIQRASDQMLRKANSIMWIDPTTKRMGPPSAREMKDTIDFITTARLLIASKKTKSGAEYKRAMEAEKALKIWESHLKTIEGDKAKKKITKRKQISKTRKKRFTAFSLRKPTADIDDIIMEKTTIKVRKKPYIRPLELTISPYSLVPYNAAKTPYGRNATDPYRKRSEERVRKISRKK